MKISEKWLREWIDVPIDCATLVDELTMLGLEIEGVTPVAPDFNGVVVGEVLEVIAHPNADKLHLCKVNVGSNNAAEHLSIVCGAANVRAGLKVPVAQIGAVLPGNFPIKKAKLRGTESFGMLCSTVELGLAESSSGLMELPNDAPIGQDIREYLDLNDNVIDIKVTPNRGDCLSVLGVARELSAMHRIELKKPTFLREREKSSDESSGISGFEVIVNAKSACPHYAGRVIKNINNKAETPLWLKERLRRSGVRSVNPVVDITNYVMLELGQPLHAFDLAKLNRCLIVRFAQSCEEIKLLDESSLQLCDADLIIADAEKPVALAGIMGGSSSAAHGNTLDVFLESAYFSPQIIQSCAKRYDLQSDSSYRFERGVDPMLQLQALERATQLVLEIAGGVPYDVIEEFSAPDMPRPSCINLSKKQARRVSGVDLTSDEIVSILRGLNMQVDGDVSSGETESFVVLPPSYRFDISIEEDLIEEIVRIYGYNSIAEREIIGTLIQPSKVHQSQTISADQYLARQKMTDFLAARGYYEIITYSFIDHALQQMIEPNVQPLKLAKNPISHDFVLRTSLWPGLIKTILTNQARQINRVRVFETGMCFREDGNGELLQSNFIAAAICGDAYPKQWGIKSGSADFFDTKSDVECLLRLLGYDTADIKFVSDDRLHSALHPKRCAKIYHFEQLLGYAGELHPRISQKLDILGKILLFEIDLSLLINKLHKKAQNASKYPFIQRDLALVVNKNLGWQQIRDKIVAKSGEILQYIQVFDVYYGDGIDNEEKGMAVRLVFQDKNRTLTDEEVEKMVKDILISLRKNFNAKLRGEKYACCNQSGVS